MCFSIALRARSSIPVRCALEMASSGLRRGLLSAAGDAGTCARRTYELADRMQEVDVVASQVMDPLKRRSSKELQRLTGCRVCGGFHVRPSTLDAKVWVTNHFRDANISQIENEICVMPSRTCAALEVTENRSVASANSASCVCTEQNISGPTVSTRPGGPQTDRSSSSDVRAVRRKGGASASTRN
jgi:hypothetical protein